MKRPEPNIAPVLEAIESARERLRAMPARGHLLACKRAHPNDETRALTEFGEITRQMCQGDKSSGERLASLAVWSVEP